MLLISVFFTVFKGAIPKAIVRVAPELNPNLNRDRAEAVELLNSLPYVKLKGNTQIHSDLFRGDDFVYDWTTDHRGFKNSPDVARRTEFFAVAVGDSFTEAMGVPLEETWTSMLTQRSHPS